MFFNQKLSKSDFETNIDLNSIFSKQWRTTVQQVDLEDPVSLSNGIAYYVKEMKIPTNVLIYRVKDFMRWYEYLSEEEKALYFDNENLTFEKNGYQSYSMVWLARSFPNYNQSCCTL